MQQLLFGQESPKPYSYHPDFLDKGQADKLLEYCLELKWKQEYVERYGFRAPNPRLECIYGEKQVYANEAAYILETEIMPNQLKELMENISTFSECKFNYLVGNYYRNADDSIEWHADKHNSVFLKGKVASLSLGQMRLFQIKEKKSKSQVESIWLEHGSLMIMDINMQYTHLHRIPKVTKGWCGSRINLTFRQWK